MSKLTKLFLYTSYTSKKLGGEDIIKKIAPKIKRENISLII